MARATYPVLVIPPTELAEQMDRHLHAWLIKHRALTPYKDELNQLTGHRRYAHVGVTCGRRAAWMRRVTAGGNA